MAALDPGTWVGAYRLEQRAGRGGEGEVFRAWDERLKRPVALKRLRVEADEAAQQRLLAEAQMLAAIDHPAIVRIHDILPATPENDRDQPGDDAWLVMEWLEGSTLAQQIERGPLGWTQAADLGARLANGLAALHRGGILHRDLKAENVILGRDGAPKILDLGIASRLRHDPRSAARGQVSSLPQSTGEGTAIGTYRCLAPEQALGRPLDVRADLFALGVLLYESLTGFSPFLGDDAEVTLHRILHEAPAEVNELRPELPIELTELIHQMLEKDPERRPKDALSVAEALRELAIQGEKPVLSMPTIPPVATPDEELAISPELTTGRSETDAKETRWPRASLPRVAAIIIGLALLTLTWQWQRTATPAPGEPKPDGQTSAGGATATTAATSLVAVPLPSFSSPKIGSEDSLSQLASSLRLAAMRGLTAATDFRPLATAEVDPVTGPPSRLARILAVNEVLSIELRCQATLCRVQASRVGAEGAVIAAEDFDIPSDDLGPAARATEMRVATLFGAQMPEAQLSVDDYGHYLTLRNRIASLSTEAARAQALPELAELRARAPLFLDAYLVEINLLRRAYQISRDPAELDRALALAKTARTLFPNQSEPVTKLAELLLEANRMEAARDAFEQLERRDPGHPDRLYLEARWAERAGEPERAIELLRRAVAERPSWRRYQNLASLESRLGHANDARRHLEALLALFPESFSGRSLLAQIELLQGDPARAASLYASLAAESEGYGVVTNLGLANLLSRSWPAAEEAFERAHKLAPDDPVALLNLADTRALLGDAAAEKTYLQVLDRIAEPSDWQQHSVQAQALAHLGRHEAAVAAMQRALRAAGERPQAAFEAALVFTLVGDLTSARVQAELALQGGVGPRWFSLAFFDPLRANLDEIASADS